MLAGCRIFTLRLMQIQYRKVFSLTHTAFAFWGVGRILLAFRASESSVLSSVPSLAIPHLSRHTRLPRVFTLTLSLGVERRQTGKLYPEIGTRKLQLRRATPLTKLNSPPHRCPLPRQPHRWQPSPPAHLDWPPPPTTSIVCLVHTTAHAPRGPAPLAAIAGAIRASRHSCLDAPTAHRETASARAFRSCAPPTYWLSPQILARVCRSHSA